MRSFCIYENASVVSFLSFPRLVETPGTNLNDLARARLPHLDFFPSLSPGRMADEDEDSIGSSWRSSARAAVSPVSSQVGVSGGESDAQEDRALALL